MVSIAPFKALRYKNGSSDLSRLICPPYDVISEKDQHELAGLDPFNFVNIELPLGRPEARSQKAAQALAQWKEKAVLTKDLAAAFYVLESTFKAPNNGRSYSRTGFFCALGVEPPGQASGIHPHERTLPKPKVERLAMLQTLKVNTSPIFGFFLDSKNTWLKTLKPCLKEPPLFHAREISGVEHRLWVVTDPESIKFLSSFLKEKEVFIADGHHRYEVAREYDPHGKILAYLCAMEDPGLILLPIHRFIRSPLPQSEWNTRIKQSFDVRPAASFEDMMKSSFHIGLFGWGQYFSLRLKKEADRSPLRDNYPEVLWDLDAVILEAYLTPEARSLAAHPRWEVRYTNNAGELVSWVKEDAGALGFFLPPTRIEQVAKVARSGQVMPPKTTFFYPKAPAGFVIYELA